jgi:hypothetical protein
MESFRWIAIALSIVLGLGVTRLLASLVVVFKSRNKSKLDWIPLVWAGTIFLWQIQFWWAIIELPGIVKVWTLGSFLTLLSLTLLLYVSAALVLPHTELKDKESLLVSFELDGRWSLVSLSAYFALALFSDWWFWGISPITLKGASLIALIILPHAFLWSRSRRLQEAISIMYILLSICSAIELSPASYK